MSNDLLDHIREINPLPDDLRAPPLGSLPALRDRDAHPTGPARRRAPARRSTFVKRAALALPLAAVVLALALLGQGGSGQFDVAAAVYKATIAGSGIHFMYYEGEASEGHATPRKIRYERWSTSAPLRERTFLVEGSNTVEMAVGNGYSWAWSNQRPHKTLRVHRTNAVVSWDPVHVIQQAYRAGRLHVLGKTTFGAHAAYRAQVLPLGDGSATVIVDAHTYMPLEFLYYGHDRKGGKPILVIRVRSYTELPETKANLALLRLAHHPGAPIVEVPASR